jgi:hypothetical protein
LSLQESSVSAGLKASVVVEAVVEVVLVVVLEVVVLVVVACREDKSFSIELATLLATALSRVQ